MNQHNINTTSPKCSHRTPTQADPEGTKSTNVLTIAGPYGSLLSRNDLPPPGTKRWVVRRKAEVVAGVRGGLISLKEALKCYNLTIDEFQSWQRLFDSHGPDGLKITRLKEYRRSKS